MGITLKTLVPLLLPALSYAQLTISPSGTAVPEELPDDFDPVVTGAAMDAFSSYGASITAAPEYQAVSSGIPPLIRQGIGGLPAMFGEDGNNRDQFIAAWSSMDDDAKEFVRSVYADEVGIYVEEGSLTGVVVPTAAAQTTAPADSGAESTPEATASGDASSSESGNAAPPKATGVTLGLVVAAGVAAGVGMAI